MYLLLLDGINTGIIFLCYLNSDVFIQFMITNYIFVIQRNMDSFGKVEIEIILRSILSYFNSN